jgi:hypothetical protein
MKQQREELKPLTGVSQTYRPFPDVSRKLEPATAWLGRITVIGDGAVIAHRRQG